MQSHTSMKQNFIFSLFLLFMIWSESQGEIALINNTWVFHMDFDVDLYNVEFYCLILLCILEFYTKSYNW